MAYIPQIHAAYERLQGELERSLKNTGLSIERVNGPSTIVGPSEFVYHLKDSSGNDVGDVYFSKGGGEMLRFELKDRDLKKTLEDVFSDGRKLFDNYVEEWEYLDRNRGNIICGQTEDRYQNEAA
jgi:hypothetical protein